MISTAPPFVLSLSKDERWVFLDIRRAVQQREGASILLLPVSYLIHLFPFIALTKL